MHMELGDPDSEMKITKQSSKKKPRVQLEMMRSVGFEKCVSTFFYGSVIDRFWLLVKVRDIVLP